jgi:hypothetical protein
LRCVTRTFEDSIIWRGGGGKKTHTHRGHFNNVKLGTNNRKLKAKLSPCPTGREYVHTLTLHISTEQR